jgi:hypothetical protein
MFFVGALHCCQPARVLAGQGFGARPEERDEKIFADQCAQSLDAVAHDLGQVGGRPVNRGQIAPPLRIERQQPLANRFVERSRQRSVMEHPERRMLAFVPMRFTFNLNLPDERGDGLNGVRHREETGQRQARIRETRVNTLADRPDATFPGQSREALDRIIGHHIVELPHQPLIGPENDCAYHTRMGWCLPFRRPWRRPFSRKHAHNPSSTVR